MRTFRGVCNLHSNMVRFIIYFSNARKSKAYKFTFQYGQIYYIKKISELINISKIYIPIWLDLLYIGRERKRDNVRRFTFQYGQIYYQMESKRYSKNSPIYIPIWLDLLSLRQLAIRQKPSHLHSNMVRFIIRRHNFQ